MRGTLPSKGLIRLMGPTAVLQKAATIVSTCQVRGYEIPYASEARDAAGDLRARESGEPEDQTFKGGVCRIVRR